MTTFFDKVIEEKRHHFPFLGEYSFDWRTGDFEPELLQRVIGMYLGRHLRKNATKKGSSAGEVLESLVSDIEKNKGNDLLGTGSGLLAIVDKLRQGDMVDLRVGLTNVTLRLKRFGTCVGIRATDIGGNVHNDATKILEQMASLSTEKGGFDYLMPFVYHRSITMPRWQTKVNKNNSIDVSAELASAARYVPDVTWCVGDGTIADALLADYVSSSPQCDDDRGGVEVGRYHDIPIYMRVLFGNDKSDHVWRKGSIESRGWVLVFNPNSSGHPLVRYVVRMADGNNWFGKAQSDINYAREQYCQGWLAKVLLGGFFARDLAESNAHTPSRMVWKEKPAEQSVEAVS